MDTVIDITKMRITFVFITRDSEGTKKIDFLEKWEKNASTRTQEEIDAHMRKPNAGIGILTGREAGITVFDFDSKDNPLFSQLYMACPTYFVETVKGFHLYYQYTTQFKTGSDRFGKGVDVRNDGGLIFASPTPGYTVNATEDINKLNDEAISLLVQNYTPEKKKGDLTLTEARNDSLFRKACGWANVYDKQMVWNKMVKANVAFRKGALEEEELESIYQQVYRYAEQKEETEENFPIEKLNLLKNVKFDKNGEKKEYYPVCMENISRLLSNHPEFQGKFRFDAWHSLDQIKKNGKWENLEDGDFLSIQSRISILYPVFRLVRKNMIEDAVLFSCRKNTIDSAADYMRSLVWDKTTRLDTWLSVVYGVENNEYHRIVGSQWLKGLAKRVLHPGSRFDWVLLLKGSQGCRKSTSMQIIGGDWYAETTMKTDHKDFFLLFRGKMLIEFSEGHTLSQSETQQMKSVVSSPVDRYRDPYARLMKDYPRRCVFSLTTNVERPLKDETGNRRFLPVQVVREVADTDWLIENREQLFAEAVYRNEVLKESSFVQDPSIEKIQEENMEESPFFEKINEWLVNPTSYGVAFDISRGITTSGIWEKCLGGSVSRLDWRSKRNIGLAMRQCGYTLKVFKEENYCIKKWSKNE